ncbi:MAG: hypothetical protein EA409_08385 [Saprospirales bacterium]|nr:MAG: hypothetical protein EA409_08385 [Saprospirales bacterium]
MVKCYSLCRGTLAEITLFFREVSRFCLSSNSYLVLLPLLLLFPFMLSAQITEPPDPCDTGSEATCKCETAPILCTIDDLDGFEYSMSTYMHPEDGPQPLCIGVPSVPNNPTWFGFLAWCEELTLLVEIENCTNVCAGTNGTPCGGGPFPCGLFGNCTRGIQIAIYGDCGYNEQVGCNVNDCGNENDKLLELQGLQIGGTYYFMVDGCAGSACDVRINVVGTCGNAEIEPWTNPIDGPDSVCVNTSAFYSVDNLQAATLYHWYIDGVEVDLTEEPNNEIIFPGEGTFELCVDVSNLPCIEVTDDPDPICMTVEVFSPFEDLGEFIECIENAPLIVDGIPYFETGFYEYIVTGPNGCDTFKQLEIIIIDNQPEDQDTVVCEDSFPFFYPPAQNTVIGPGSYFVPATDQFGCDSSYIINFYTLSIDIQLFSIPDTLFCPSESIAISDFGFGAIIDNPEQTIVEEVEFEWFFNGEARPDLEGRNIEVNEAGEYTLIVTAFYNDIICIDSASITIPENFITPPQPLPHFPLEACINTTQEIFTTNYTGDLSVNWSLSGPGTFITQAADSALIRFDSIGSVEICINYFYPDCPELIADSCFVIQVTDGLIPEIIGPNYFCEGQSTTLFTDSSYELIQWNGQESDSLIVSQSGTITLFVVDSLGCNGTAEIQINEALNPEPQILGSPVFCEEGFTELSLDQAYSEILWSTGEGSQFIEVNFEGTVTASVADSLGCSGTASIEITLEEELQLAITGPNEICEGETAILSTIPSFATYEWSTGSIQETLVIGESGTYTVEVGDGRGCFGTAEFNLIVNELPEGDLIADKEGLCPGENLELVFVTSNNISEFLWSDSSTDNTLIVNASGVYELTVTDEKGCKATFDIAIVDFDAPIPEIDGLTEFCSGELVTLSVDDFFDNYQWSTGDTTNETTISSGGSFSITVTDENECTGIALFSVTENPLPQPQITGPNEICDGQNATLGVSQSFSSYLWSTGSIEDEIIVSVSGPIELEVFDDNGCSNTTVINFTVNPLPEINFTGSTTFCTGFSTTLTIGNFPEINWSTGANDNSITIDEEGLYTVSVSDENGCSNEAEIFINEDEELQPVISGEPGFCPGNSTELNAGDSFEDYAWSTGSNNPQIIVNSPGVYTVTVTDSDGCTGSASISVVLYELPEPEIQGDEFICFGESTTLEVTELFESYDWSTGSSEQSILVNQSGNFFVTVTDQNNCTGTADFNVVLNEEIIPLIEGPADICEGDFATIEGEEGFSDYLWSNGNTDLTITTSSAGDYYLTVTDENGCTGEGVFTLVTIPLPIANAGEDQVLDCLTDLVFLGSDGLPHLSYQWFEEGIENPFSNNPIIETADAGTFILVVTDNNTACTNEDQVTVLSDPTDINGFQISFNNPLCFGENNGAITIDGIDGGTAPFIFELNGEISDAGIFTNLPNGSYNIVIRDDKGCEVDTLITLTNPPAVIVELGPDININFGEEIFLEGDVSIGPERIAGIEWLINGIPQCDPCEELTLLFDSPEGGLISLIVTDINGCFDSDQILITVTINRDVYIPNAFSPNKDGVNDVFIVYGPENLFEIEYIKIFDRWGSKVFERSNIPPNDPVFGWNGEFRGERLNPGIFVYQLRVRYVDGNTKDFNGDLLLTE